MLQFAHIRLFYAFAIIPLLLLLFFLVKRWRKKTIAGLGDSPVVMQLMQDVSVRKFNLRFVLQLIAVCFIIMGLIDPQIGSRLQESKRKGADVMIALDVSNSMKAEDLTPNRLERAKESISKLIDRLGGDRISASARIFTRLARTFTPATRATSS